MLRKDGGTGAMMGDACEGRSVVCAIAEEVGGVGVGERSAEWKLFSDTLVHQYRRRFVFPL